jgi:hypothetical protein
MVPLWVWTATQDARLRNSISSGTSAGRVSVTSM